MVAVRGLVSVPFVATMSELLRDAILFQLLRFAIIPRWRDIRSAT